MKKNHDDVEHPTAEKLVLIAKEQHKKIMDKALKTEEANQKRIAELTTEEKELKAEIEAGRKQLEKMIVEFSKLEKEATVRNLEEVKEDALTVAKVKSGKISMAEFSAKGKTDEDIERTVMLKTQDDLESASDAIRTKAVDVVKLELSLSTVQNTVHNLMLNPVRTILSNYIELKDMLSFQLGPLAEEGHSSLNEKIQKEHQLMLIQHGVSVGGGYVWESLSIEEAYRLKLDPILPKEHIPLLLEKLAEFNADDNVLMTVTFRPKGSFFPGDPVEVREE